MLKLQTQQQVEVEQLKRSSCQVMTEKWHLLEYCPSTLYPLTQA
jgi:hypothetical protein